MKKVLSTSANTATFSAKTSSEPQENALPFWKDVKQHFWKGAVRDVDYKERLLPQLILDPIKGDHSELSLSFVRQLRYLRKKMGRPFYKFKTPYARKHKRYVRGDSWPEFFNVSDRTFRTHMKPMTTEYGSKTSYDLAVDKFKGRPALCYVDQRQNLTYWDFNPDYEEQFSKDFFKKSRSSEKSGDGHIEDRISDGFSDAHYTEIQSYNPPLKVSSTDKTLTSEIQEEGRLPSSSDEQGDLAQTSCLAEKTLFSKKANKPHRQQRQRQATHRARKKDNCNNQGKKQTSRHKHPYNSLKKPLLSQFEQNKVDEMQDIFRACTAITNRQTLSQEAKRRALRALNEDFGGDLQRWRAYCVSLETSDFLMRRTGGSDFKVQFLWSTKDWVIAKVKSGAYQIKQLYQDLVDAIKPPIEAIQKWIVDMKAEAQERNLRLRILEKVGRDAYLSWFKGLKIRLEGRTAVFEASSEFALMKLTEKFSHSLDHVCGSVGLKSKVRRTA